MAVAIFFLVMFQDPDPFKIGKEILLKEGASVAIPYFENLAIAQDDPKALYYVGWALYEDGNAEEAETIANYLISQEPNDRIMGHCYYLLGVIENQRMNPLAVDYFENAKIYYSKIPSYGSLYRVSCGIAASLIFQEKFLEAQTHLNHALRFRRKSKKPENTAYCHELLSRVFFGLGEYEAALEEAKESHRIFENFGDSIAASIALSSVAFYEIISGRAEEGLINTREVDSIIYSSEDKFKKLSYYHAINWILLLRCSENDYSKHQNQIQEYLDENPDQLLKKLLNFAISWECGKAVQ